MSVVETSQHNESPLSKLLSLLTCANASTSSRKKHSVKRTRSRSSKSDESKHTSHVTFSSKTQIAESTRRVHHHVDDSMRAFHGRHNTVPIPASSSSSSYSKMENGSSLNTNKSKVGSHSAPITIPFRFRRERTCSRNKMSDSPFFIPPHLIREDEEAQSLRERMRRERAHRHNVLCLKYDADRNGTPCNTPTTPITTTRHTVSMKDVIQNPDTPCTCDVCICETTPKAHTWG